MIARIGIPSKKGLPQIGQSIEGFKSLLGTRSSSAGAARISHGTVSLKTRNSPRILSFFQIQALAAQYHNLHGSRLLTHHPETLD